MNICYIQARGGSKRFPGKNLALWNGKPMLADAIQKAIFTGLFQTILVTSDSEEILECAYKNGALPIWRTASEADDFATDDDVAAGLLVHFSEALYICKLYPCVPLLEYSQIRDAYGAWMLSKNDNGIYATYPDGRDAGAFYLFRNAVYRRIRTLSLDGFPWVKYPIENACDINTPEDLEEAKRKAAQ